MRIERWHSRFLSPRPLPESMLAAWHGHLDRIDERQLLDGLVADDEWLLIDRLPLSARWRLDAADPLFDLQQALRSALVAAIEEPTRVVRYDSRRHAWADLLYRAALGDCRRAWAWARMDLLPAQVARAPSPAGVLTAAASGLAADPRSAWPVLRRLLAAESDCAAFTALLGAMPQAGWMTLLGAVPQIASYLRSGPMASLPTRPTDWPPSGAGDQDGQTALLAWIARQPWLAERHAAIVAPLLAALTWPGAGASPALRMQRLLRARAYCQAGPARQPPPTPRRTPAMPTTPIAAVESADEASCATPSVSGGEPVDPLELPPPAIESLPTAWGGALFWLGRVAAGGVLDWLAAQPEAPEATLALFLAALADALGVPPDDPVRRVFLADPAPGVPPATLVRRAASLCADWQGWLDEAAPDMPSPRLAYVCRRDGGLRLEPGWIELVLPLDSVDTSIRRLGLDLDPGWLPWLGCVVRIRYE
jgi:hypothetical protein